MGSRRMMFTIQWQITSLCPNRCKHCYIEEKCDDSVTYEKFCEAYRKIEKFENEHDVSISRIAITGGDPLMNPDAWKILALLQSKNVEVSILGIPEELTDENISQLKGLGVRHYQVSLDGLEATHDKIRGKGSFKQTVQALRVLTENDIEHTVMFTANSLNYTELIPLINLLDKQSVCTHFAFDFMVGDVVSNQGIPAMVSPDEAMQTLVEYSKLSRALAESNSTVKLFEKCTLSRVLNGQTVGKTSQQLVNYPFCDGCANGIYGLAILPNGDVYPCRRLPIAIGNIFEDELDKLVLEHDLMQKFRNSDSYQYCGDCLYFNMCRGCPAISFAFNGDPFSRYPYCFLKETTSDNGNLKCTSMEEIMQCEPNVKLNMSKRDYMLRLLKNYLQAK